jgi:hypothetical protein
MIFPENCPNMNADIKKMKVYQANPRFPKIRARMINKTGI